MVRIHRSGFVSKRHGFGTPTFPGSKEAFPFWSFLNPNSNWKPLTLLNPVQSGSKNMVIWNLFAFLATLTKHDNMLRAMFSGRMEVLTDSDGWILIDRQKTSTLRFVWADFIRVRVLFRPSPLIYLDIMCFNSIPVTSYIFLDVMAPSVSQPFSLEQFRNQQRHIKYILYASGA